VRLLLNAKADVEAKDQLRATALRFAAGGRPVPVVRMLLDAGASLGDVHVSGTKVLHAAAAGTPVNPGGCEEPRTSGG